MGILRYRPSDIRMGAREMIGERIFEEKVKPYKLYVCMANCPYAKGTDDKHTCEGWYYVNDD